MNDHTPTDGAGSEPAYLVKEQPADLVEEQLIDLTATYDEKRLTSEQPVDAPRDEDAPPHLRERYRKAVACIQLLERSDGSFHTPDRLGRYEIVHELGRGGFSVVYRAVDTKLGREVALKLPRPEVLMTAEMRRRFVREAHAAAALDHPHIVPVYEAGELGPLLYIASAYCPGPTLAAWIRSQTESIPFHVAAGLVATLATAVAHAHHRGIWHRDLKPSNVLLQMAESGGPRANQESRARANRKTATLWPSALSPPPSARASPILAWPR